MNDKQSIVPQRHIYAAMIVAISMMAALLWMPSVLGALAKAYGLAPADLGHIAFAELTGFVLGTFISSTKSVRELKRWILGGCALVIAVNAGLLLSAGPPPGLLRLLAGIGSGFGFGYGLKLCAMSAMPTRSFGIFTGSMSVVMILGFQLIAQLVDTHPTVVALHIVFGAYAALALMAGLIYWTHQPPVAAAPSGGQRTPMSIPKPLVLLGLLAIGLAFVGQGSIWAFLQTLGISHGYTVGGVANAMSAFAIMGVAGSFLASMIPHRMPRWVAMTAALLALGCGLYALYAPRSLLWYVAGCAIGGFYWNFILPLMLGLLARIDKSGQGSVLGGTMSSVGSGLGPLLAGLLIVNADYRPVGWMAGLLCLASLACVWLIERRSASGSA